MTKTWLIEARDTLMVRDSRPAGDGLSMRSLPFPWPSTITGLARTRAGSDENGQFTLTKDEAEQLLELEVLGPWLIALDAKGEAREYYFPGPKDCLWHDQGEALIRTQLIPKKLDEDCASNLPKDLEILQPAHELPEGKASKRAPAFWSWKELERWLLSPSARQNLKADFGLPGLVRETRTHVAIDPKTGTADEGKLFSTEMLRFADTKRQLALGFACADPRIKRGIVHLGGERRLSSLRASDKALPKAPIDNLLADNRRRFRVVLLTPAIFEAGWKPKDSEGAKLVAAAVGRPETISGWDFAARGPKACRRMAPAGSVYWYELSADTDIKEWIEMHWMKPISDDEQNQRDGFGLCVVGVG